MIINPIEVLVRDLVDGYEDRGENGVFGYGGKLDIRPPYQREFIYDDKKRDEVLNTVNKGFPLNVMYWVLKEDGNYEILDGQQRTLSICQYVNGDYSLNGKFFQNLTQTEQDKILDYKLMIYVCEGNDLERLEWFRVINIAGEVLSDQELRNANYTGPWLSDAKKHFSKNNNPARGLFDKYMSVKWNRQEGLEEALSWIAASQNTTIELYMATHQFDEKCDELWEYFNSVVTWVQKYFCVYRSQMKGLPWGILYNQNKDRDDLKPDEIEANVKVLMMDNEVQKKAGIYEYLLDGKENHLHLRRFDDDVKRGVYEQQNGICPLCGEHFEYEQMHGDHKIPWSKGGKTVVENCQMLCTECNIKKSNL